MTDITKNGIIITRSFDTANKKKGMSNMSEKTFEKGFDRFEPVTNPPLSLVEYQILRAQLKRCQRNLMGNDLENMEGYLRALELYLTPVITIIIYPVSLILETAKRLRTWDATRYDLVSKIDSFIVAIDREIRAMER